MPTIFQDAPKNSTVMQLGRKLPNMTSKQTRVPVLSMLPLAYWVNGDTGFKQTSRQAWENVYLTAAELAVIVPIPEAVLADADFDILGLSAADYPELPMVEDDFSVSIQQKLLRAMIEETAFAVSTNESRPIHTGALFEITDQGLTMVAVDGFRLAIRREPLEKIDGGAFSFVAPGSALGEVKNICSDVEDLAAVTLGKSHILFEVGDTELICRRLEGEFLDYKNAIPRKNPISVIADTKALIESIDRVSVVISEKQKSPVRCLFDHDKVLLSAKTGNGEAKDICRLSGDGGGLEIGFNNKYMMDALKAAPKDQVTLELSSPITPCIIVPAEGEENFLFMVLPVRLKADF